MLVRAVVAGAVAAAVTYWLGDLLAEPGPSWPRAEPVLAALAACLFAPVISIMGESLIEDLAKLVLVGVVWLATQQFEMVDLVTSGMLIGALIGTLNNRLPGR